MVLSHSVLASQKLIRFLGVISLLIIFELLNFLLHPWLGQITHASPVLMLLVMVALAAVLLPLHHQLEHWITCKLVEKTTAYVWLLPSAPSSNVRVEKRRWW